MTWDELQDRATEQVKASIADGHTAICLTAPTGFGKTRIMVKLIEWLVESSRDVAMFTNRRLLCQQTKGVLESHGIEPGMRAAGYDKATLRPVQLCMTQTIGSRVFNGQDELPTAALVLVDEGHLQKGDVMERIIAHYHAQQVPVVSFTASPLDMGEMYDHLIVAATMTEARDCGAIVWSETYAPDEPDLKSIRKYQVGADLSAIDNSKAIMRPGIFGRVYDHWRQLNPDGEPTILFGPDVNGSIFFAEQFWKQGVRAAHIDGSDVWLDGEWIGRSNEDAREYVLDLVRGGQVPVICNRYVLREGIDLPELRHGILATVFGALSSYVQSCGRLLRSAEGKERAIIQDHGGNWHRHGSINEDREWDLNLSNHKAVAMRQERIRERKGEVEPVVCPFCHRTRWPGPAACPSCGKSFEGKSRMVVQVDGSLKPVAGDIYRPRYTKQKPDTQKQWDSVVFGHRRIDRTYQQAYAWFLQKNNYYPPRTMARMPKEMGDWFAKIGDVPPERLHQ